MLYLSALVQIYSVWWVGESADDFVDSFMIAYLP